MGYFLTPMIVNCEPQISTEDLCCERTPCNNNEFIEYEFYNNEDKYTKFIHYIEERYCSVPEKNNNIDGGDFDSTFFMN